MKRLISVMAAGAFSAALIAAPVPAVAASQARHGRIWIVADIRHRCVALESHGRRRAVTAAHCSRRRDQSWSYREPFIVAASGLCLTATWDSRVVTARCGQRGQRWNRLDPRHLPRHRLAYWLQPQRYPGVCMVITSAQPGPPDLGPCGGPLGAHGGTQRWIFARQ